MRRRTFITLCGGAAAWPLAARGQQPAIPTVGFLDAATATPTQLTTFGDGLKTEGFVQNQSVAVAYRAAQSDYSQLPALAAELVNPKVAAIAAVGAPAALAAKAATATIPIIFAVASDPVPLGLVGGLNRPGGNVTGITNMGMQIPQKRLQLMHQLIPAATIFAFLVNPNNPDAAIQTAAARAAANTLGLQVDVLHAGSERDFEPLFAKLAQLRAGGLAIGDDGLFMSRSEQLGALALRREMPAIFEGRAFAAAGGVMSYGSSPTEFYHQLGAYCGLMLKGAKASDLPVFQSTQVEVIINLKTAKALGIAVPAPLRDHAGEVIQ